MPVGHPGGASNAISQLSNSREIDRRERLASRASRGGGRGSAVRPKDAKGEGAAEPGVTGATGEGGASIRSVKFHFTVPGTDTSCPMGPDTDLADTYVRTYEPLARLDPLICHCILPDVARFAVRSWTRSRRRRHEDGLPLESDAFRSRSADNAENSDVARPSIMRPSRFANHGELGNGDIRLAG